MDKRIQRTRQSLQQSLLALLAEQPFEGISIQAITDRADTARVTFYRHYGTKEELLLDAMEDIYQSLKESIEAVSGYDHILDFSATPPDLVLFDFLAQNRPLYKRLMTGSISALIQQRLRHYIVQHVTLAFNQAPDYADLPTGLIANHMASNVIGNVMWWLSEDLPYSPAYMARITHWMSLTGIMAWVGNDDKFMQSLPSADEWRPF